MYRVHTPVHKEGAQMETLPRSRAIPWPSLPVGAAIISLCLSFVAVGCGGEPVEEKAVARPVKILTIGGPNSAGWREYPGTIRGAQTAEMAFEVSAIS